jgi:uncharacterized protein YbcI
MNRNRYSQSNVGSAGPLRGLAHHTRHRHGFLPSSSYQRVVVRIQEEGETARRVVPDTSEHPANNVRSGNISTSVVRVFGECTGRGPTKARTNITDSVVTVVLQDTLTKGELSLARAGREELVLEMRRAFQQAMRTDLVSAVESAMSRPVAAFFSDNSIDPDMAVETFVLGPVAPV